MSRVASPAKVQYGVVVIFDKVITGFRIALGGAQAIFGIAPDLTAI